MNKNRGERKPDEPVFHSPLCFPAVDTVWLAAFHSPWNAFPALMACICQTMSQNRSSLLPLFLVGCWVTATKVINILTKDQEGKKGFWDQHLELSNRGEKTRGEIKRIREIKGNQESVMFWREDWYCFWYWCWYQGLYWYYYWYW